MDQLTLFLVVTLAAVRLSALVATEDGPADMARRLRAWAAATLPAREVEPGYLEDHWVTRGLHCPLCVSFWLTLPAGLVARDPWAWPLWWWASAGLAWIILRIGARP